MGKIIRKKRPALIAFGADEEMIGRLKSLADKMGVTASDIARSALEEKMDDLEAALSKGQRFEVRRPLGTIRQVA